MIVIDQVHTKNIAVIRGDGGAIGLTEDRYKIFFLFLPILLNLQGGL